MEIEKTLQVQAPREEVWKLLLDPHVMTGAVPGMKSIEVISDTEYVAQMHVKISFISAKFKLHTHIVEQREPEYLRVEGSGEDQSVASSLKQNTEIFLTETAEGDTEVRIKAKVDVLGRLGTFGFAVMKTKADRLWDEFSNNLATRLESPETIEEAAAPSPEKAPISADSAGASDTTKIVPPASKAAEQPRTAQRRVEPATAKTSPADQGGWFARLISGTRPTAANRQSGSEADSIRIEVRSLEQTITIDWPVSAAHECREWLEKYLAKAQQTNENS